MTANEEAREMGIIGRSLILAWNTWHLDTAEHQTARDKVLDDFAKDCLLKLTQAYNEGYAKGIADLKGQQHIEELMKP